MSYPILISLNLNDLDLPRFLISAFASPLIAAIIDKSRSGADRHATGRLRPSPAACRRLRLLPLRGAPPPLPDAAGNCRLRRHPWLVALPSPQPALGCFVTISCERHSARVCSRRTPTTRKCHPCRRHRTQATRE